MGLFDFIKNTDATKRNEPSNTAEQLNTVIHEQILANTQAVATLLTVPAAERNEDWLNEFINKLPLAALRCGSPQVIAGPDGFPYFQLFVPEPGEEFQSFVIDEMITGFLLERGFGVVINPGATQPDWILSYGDIMNYHLNNSFFTTDSLFSVAGEVAPAKLQESKVIVLPLTEKVLPAAVRKLLREFLELNGMQQPKVMLLEHQSGSSSVRDLAFNITAASFENEEHYRNLMQTLTWYLPRHYSIIGLDEAEVGNGFTVL